MHRLGGQIVDERPAGINETDGPAADDAAESDLLELESSDFGLKDPELFDETDGEGLTRGLRKHHEAGAEDAGQDGRDAGEAQGRELEASAGGGTVQGRHHRRPADQSSSSSTRRAVDPDDVELLQDMTTAAVNEAIRSAQELAQRRMGEITGGMNIPGLM